MGKNLKMLESVSINEMNFIVGHADGTIDEVDKLIPNLFNVYKSASSRLIKREFSQVRKSLWKEMF